MKTTVEDCFELDMTLLKKEGYLESSRMGKMTWKEACFEREALIRSSMAHPSLSVLLEGHMRDYELTSLECVYGGRKWFFLCHCGRRCRKLYLPPDEEDFACKECHDLTYLLQASHRSSDYPFFRLVKRLQRTGNFLTMIGSVV